MSDKQIECVMLGVFVGIIITAVLFVLTSQPIQRLPIGSELSHPITDQWKARGWQDDKAKIFESASSALKYLESEAQSKLEY